LFQTASQTEKASFKLFSFLLICSETKPTFDRSNKTKAQLLGSGLKQWNLLEEVVIVSFCTKRQPDIAVYYSVNGYSTVLK